MIETNNATVNSKSVTAALQKMFDSDAFDGANNARIAKIAGHVGRAQQDFKVAMTALIHKNCKKDKAGNVIMDKQGNFKWLSAKAQKDHQAAFMKLLDSPVNIPATKINVKDIPGGVVSANEMGTLTWMLDGMPKNAPDA